jgi:hypothetical protein
VDRNLIPCFHRFERETYSADCCLIQAATTLAFTRALIANEAWMEIRMLKRPRFSPHRIAAEGTRPLSTV